MTRRYVIILAALLTAAGLAVFFYKWQVLGFPLSDNQQTPTWVVETAIEFDTGPGSIKVNLQIPTVTPGFKRLDEYAVSKNYGFGVNYVGTRREAQWTVRRDSGAQTLYYRIVVAEDRNEEQTDITPPFPLPPVIEEPLKTAVDVIVEQVREHSADAASFATELLRYVNDPSPDANVELLLSDARGRAEFVRTMTMILASARIPARMIRGLQLSNQQSQADILPWLEVHDGDSWRFFNPANGEESLPDRYLIWWRGTDPLVRLEGGSNANVNFAVKRYYLDTMDIARKRAAESDSLLVEFSLFSLPIKVQAVYGVILMIPLGALIVVLMRNVIGIVTFGTFMPVLIALSFRETQLLRGIVLFALLVALGLSIRFLLERLRLLLVPRLSAVLVVVVLLMLFISILTHKLGIETGLSIALFPMVIIAMTIERMSVVWEESGAAVAMRNAMGSLTVAIVAYLVMGMDWLEHLIFTFPELLLLVLASVILLGRYTGYRLSELKRFKSLAN
ncbi:MAG: inactive transglutaminase family protein [Woeseia sp.]|nr:inactive transglutaminase family protein [Woeseia sp.]MBT8097285.1 inactive transglutaminase family protein [Woeseia sp.]NNE61137.1 inactive transglutaminase family protein [Woeseia sp.]NNL54428.1 inactive transglutaminase family protein [Woeseia sp.]